MAVGAARSMTKKRGRPRGQFKYPVIDGKKLCGKCLRVLRVSDFGTTTNKYGMTYYRPACRDCVALQKTAWMQKRWKGRYRKVEIAKMRDYYMRNREQIRNQRRRKILERVRF